MNLRNTLSEAVTEILQQGLELLAAVDDRDYVASSAGPFDASIGEHYRHVLEHFSVLAGSLRVGSVNYDSRRRDRQIEHDRGYATKQTMAIVARFKGLSDEAVGGECEVLYQIGYGQVRQVGMRSSVAREVVFAVSHAVHHFALIRVRCAELGIELDPSFGVAPSTLAHRQVNHAA